MIAALYGRVSTSDGRQDADNQLAELRRFAASQDWDVAGEYVDHESGKTGDRAHFRRLFKDAAQRKFDVVLFWSLDRFTREGALATLQYLNTLTNYGVGYRSFTEPYLDSCGMFREAIIAILGTIAKQERVRLSERVKAGLARARRQEPYRKEDRQTARRISPWSDSRLMREGILLGKDCAQIERQDYDGAASLPGSQRRTRRSRHHGGKKMSSETRSPTLTLALKPACQNPPAKSGRKRRQPKVLILLEKGNQKE